ncbi:unnamed protein product [Closterium sp. NIES-64]|nr:unnamed protein product [Closterium sp. NIES-64]
MTAGNALPAFLQTILATLLLSCLLLPLAPVRAFNFDCANEASETVAVLSFCNGNGWRHTCLYGSGYATDGSGKCTLVQRGALYCEDCQGTLRKVARCCDIDLSGYELSGYDQASTDDIEWGISSLQCPGNSGCADFGYPQGFHAMEPRTRSSSSGGQLRGFENFPREESAAQAEEKIRAEPPQPTVPRGNGALAGGKTKMSRRLWGSGRPWSFPKMYSRRLYGSGRPWYP